MSPIVECVPNFSEGRDKVKISRLVQVLAAIEGIHVLDIHSDADHNRSVITFAGPSESIEKAAVLAAGEACRLIDLNRHQGVHPRIGATDVIPFVPLQGGTLADCVAMAHRVGHEIWTRYQIPVYFYEAAALRPERRNLATIRQIGFEKLREVIETDPSRRPDIGGPGLHPTAGATVVGAREVLVAFNINLNTDDVEAARAIARAVRASGGGLPAVKAMGVLLRSRAASGGSAQAQVSMNLTDWKKTSVAKAFEAVEREALARSVTVHSSEIIGLAPAEALGGVSPSELKLTGFGPEKVLENRLAQACGTATGG